MRDALWMYKPFQSVIEGLLHTSSIQSSVEKNRHSVFIGLHLLAGVLALASLPFCLLLARANAPEGVSSMGLLPLWMLAPLLSVAYLSKTGKLTNAFLLTAGLTAGFVIWVASLSGGIHSPHLIWLGVIPLEVMLAGNGRIIKQALAICLAALAVLVTGDIAHILPVTETGSPIISGLSLMGAMLYGGMLAIRIDRMNRNRLDAVEAEEMRYRSLTNYASDMIARHDRSGDVTFASRAARDLFELPPQDLMRNGMFHRIHIQDRPAYLQALSQCMNNTDDNRPAIAVELRIMRDTATNKDGSVHSVASGVRWVEMRCAPERDEAGKITGAITTTRDISKRMQKHFAMEKAMEEAELANESKTCFLANVTHELRTPLNTIIGFSEILCHPELTKNNEERNREYAQLIHKGGTHLLQLVTDLLDMSRLESGNFEVSPQPFDLCDLTQSCCKMMQTEADQRGIALYSQFEEQSAEVFLDPRSCRQILLNLISNSLKFSDKGGQVSVALSKVSKSVDGVAQHWMKLVISDNGIGIDKCDIPKLGKPFVQAESSLQRRFEGAGIGLSIVRGLCELQKGDMQIDSKLGRGTRVTITLPVDMTTILDNDQSGSTRTEAIVAIGAKETDKNTNALSNSQVA